MELRYTASLPIILFIYLTIAEAAVRRGETLFDVYGNYLQPKEYHNPDPKNCCLVPTCEDNGQCFDKMICGHVCSQGNYRPAYFGPTPGYRLKEYYVNFECHFGECRDYKFMCTHCPDPNIVDFSIFTVRKDCVNCYH